jgi:hypothetical protein
VPIDEAAFAHERFQLPPLPSPLPDAEVQRTPYDVLVMDLALLAERVITASVAALDLLQNDSEIAVFEAGMTLGEIDARGGELHRWFELVEDASGLPPDVSPTLLDEHRAWREHLLQLAKHVLRNMLIARFHG